MTVRIRLSRGGSKKHPYYRVVAADQRAPRDGRFIEKLGSFNPLLPQDHQDRLVLDVEKVKAWLAKGAQPTDRLQKLFANLGLCEAPKIGNQPKKSAPKAKAPRPSITKFTNNKCVTFKGSSTPKNGEIALTITAVTLITSWNLQNFKILW